MLRTALRPASLGLLAVLLAAAALFGFLGRWQLHRAYERAGVSPTETVVPLASVLEPASAFTGRADQQRVAVTGRWVAGDTVVVAGRPLHGRPGQWVVSALRVDSSGALLPVVRGWLPSGASAPAPPPGVVHLTGRLEVSEDPAGVSAGGRVRAVSSADLVNLWSPPLYTGFLVAAAAPAPLAAVPAPPPSRHLDLQNLSYAFQWWLFAVFAVLFWGRWVRDRHLRDLEDEADAEADAEVGAEVGAAAGTEAWEDGSHVPALGHRERPSDDHHGQEVRT